MKNLKSIPESWLTPLIYVFIFLLSIGPLMKLWKVADKVIFSRENLTDLNIERPMIRMANDVYFNLNSKVLGSDLSLYQKIQKNELIFEAINVFVFMTIFILVLMQLKTIVFSLREKSFFITKNIKCVKTISGLLLLYVLINFALYQSIQFFIPSSVIQDTYNYCPVNRGLIIGLLFSVDFKTLLGSFAFYIISVVFREGYELKEQTELTI